MMTSCTMNAFKSVSFLQLLSVLFGQAIAGLVVSNEKSCPSGDISVTSETGPLVDGNLTSCISFSKDIAEASWTLSPQQSSSFQVKVTLQGDPCSSTHLEVFSDMGCVDPRSKQECPKVAATQGSNPGPEYSCFYNCTCGLPCSKLYTRMYPAHDGSNLAFCEIALI